MISSALPLTSDQVKSFNYFLLDGTDHALRALETVFELSIESSDSSIEIAPSANNENLKHFGSGCLYIVSSALVGEINGGIVLFIRADDFNYLGQVMQPVMNMLSMSSPDANLASLDGQTPEFKGNPVTGLMDTKRYREDMLDALAEMGNILIGLYTRSFYKIFGLNTHHSVPLVMRDAQQTTTQRVLWSSGGRLQQHLAIENEFFLNDKPIKLWCLISPTQESFQKILDGIDGQVKPGDKEVRDSTYKFKG